MNYDQETNDNQPTFAPQITTGIAGLDEILMGGLPRRHLYLVEGNSGTGKTTLGLQFLLEGARHEERTLLITLAEAAADLNEVARSHGWSLDALDVFELPPLKQAHLEEHQTIFPTAEVELNEANEQILSALREKRPQRVVIDSLTELRLLAADPVRFRFQMLALNELLVELKATVIFIDRLAPGNSDRVLDSMVHGIIQLQQHTRAYGEILRRLQIGKMRGSRYQSGWHDFRIKSGGLEVYPRLQVGQEHEKKSWQQLSSGVAGLDTLLGGGLELGTAALIGGASGTGKSSVATLFVHTALQQEIPCAMLLFDERAETLFKRSQELEVPLRAHAEEGALFVRQIDTGVVSAGEFAHMVRTLVEEQGVRVLAIDSLTGYMRAVSEEALLLNQMHDLLNYLSRNDVLSLLIVTQHGLVGEQTAQLLDLSYLSDTVLLLRYFEAGGALHHAISVVKKRHGRHEKTIRELSLLSDGVAVGEPLDAFRGVLTGNPEYTGRSESLMDTGNRQRQKGSE